MLKEGELFTEIKLIGFGIDDFLRYKGVSEIEKDGDGHAVVARFAGEENCVDTVFGKIGLDFDLVNETRNRAIVLFNSGLRKRGSKNQRKISIDHGTGVGVQALTDRVKIAVQTNAGSEIFARKDK